MKILKFVGLLLFLIILDAHATAQECVRSSCVKKSASVQTMQNDMTQQSVAEIIKYVNSSKAECSKVCDPSACPPECRILCQASSAKAAVVGQVSPTSNAKEDFVLLPKRPIRVLSAPGVVLD